MDVAEPPTHPAAAAWARRFSSWHRWQPVRNVAAAIAVIKQRRQEERDQRDAQQDGGDQQQQQRGKRGKPGDDRRGGDRRGQHGQQQQQQPASKQQRLERPGKHAGASPAMVVGGQVRTAAVCMRLCAGAMHVLL